MDEPTNIQSDANTLLAKRLLRVIEDNMSSYQEHAQRLRAIKELDRATFIVDTPKGTRRLPSGLIRQITEKIVSKMQRPASTYSASSDVPDEIKDDVAKIVRDAAKTCQEEGGYRECLKVKPSAYRDMIMFANAAVRIGIDIDSPYPIRYDNIELDKIWVDKNARVMRSKRGTRQVTRIVIIETFDYEEARMKNPGISFGKGRIPRSSDTTSDLNDTPEETYNDNEVEFAHMFDIGGDKPVHVVYAGAKMKLIKKLEGVPADEDSIEDTAKKYPYFWKKTGEAFIPIDFLRCFESVEGFWDYGVGDAFYKYAIVRRQLLNKAINQSLQAMSDISVMDMKKGKAQTMISRYKDAQRMVADGKKGIIMNDTGEPVTVTQVEAQKFEAAVAQLYEQLDKEIKRWGINLDAIREAQSTTATQILQEAEVEDEFVQERLNINTGFFKFFEEATINFMEIFVSEDNDSPIRSKSKMVVSPNGIPQEVDMPQKSLGFAAELSRKHTFFIEVATKTGIIQKDTTKAARAMAMFRLGANDPAIAKKSLEEFGSALSFEMPEGAFAQQQTGSQAGVKGAEEQLTGQAKDLTLV